jgi:branched-chain amino acid transport system substrate-binding protein
MTSRTADSRFSRRTVLKAGAATTVLGAPGLLLAQPAAVKIGLVHPVSGGLAYSGGQGRLGCQMAIDEINAAGGIKSMGGAKLEAALGDSQSRVCTRWAWRPMWAASPAPSRCPPPRPRPSTTPRS